MVPNASEIIRRRLTVRTCIRVFAAAFACFGLLPIISWVQEGLRDGDLWDMSYYLDRIVFSVFFPFVSVMALLFQRLLVRFFVPIRRHVMCPACGYRIEGLVEPRCSECGLVLTAEFLDPTALPELVRHGDSLVAARRETVAVVFRTVGVFAAMFIGIIWLLMAVVVGLWVSGSEESVFDSEEQVLTFFIRGSATSVFGAMLLFRSRWLARLVVPRAKGSAKSPVPVQPEAASSE
ncbi:MAG: hypothetical protein ACI89L_001199 [Phycisphaerales bacterium]|jgi:hypothetical protein